MDTQFEVVLVNFESDIREDMIAASLHAFQVKEACYLQRSDDSVSRLALVRNSKNCTLVVIVDGKWMKPSAEAHVSWLKRDSFFKETMFIILTPPDDQNYLLNVVKSKLKQKPCLLLRPNVAIGKSFDRDEYSKALRLEWERWSAEKRDEWFFNPEA